MLFDKDVINMFDRCRTPFRVQNEITTPLRVIEIMAIGIIAVIAAIHAI